MQDLNLTLIQADLIWEQIDENLRQFDTFLNALNTPTDLIVLPEMFTTGFSMKPNLLAEVMHGKTTQWMIEKAKFHNALVIGSFIVKEGDKFFNRLLAVQPDGTFYQYDKRHLFGMAGEEDTYQRGEKRLIFEYKGWRICPLICYDLRFPAWARNKEPHGVAYDLLIYVANWPEMRSVHWQTLLKARAIENQAYTIGVNRIGTDGNGIYHSGDSAVISPTGVPLFEQAHQPVIFTQKLSAAYLKNIRQKLPFLKDMT